MQCPAEFSVDALFAQSFNMQAIPPVPACCPHDTDNLAGCGKTLLGCHPERSEGSRSAYLLENAQGQILRCAQNDSFEEFFRSLLGV
jgi:hypothetical protein